MYLGPLDGPHMCGLEFSLGRDGWIHSLTFHGAKHILEAHKARYGDEDSCDGGICEACKDHLVPRHPLVKFPRPKYDLSRYMGWLVRDIPGRGYAVDYGRELIDVTGTAADYDLRVGVLHLIETLKSLYPDLREEIARRASHIQLSLIHISEPTRRS